jgi:hypothetical protein
MTLSIMTHSLTILSILTLHSSITNLDFPLTVTAHYAVMLRIVMLSVVIYAEYGIMLTVVMLTVS